jgi:hypothetical protein
MGTDHLEETNTTGCNVGVSPRLPRLSCHEYVVKLKGISEPAGRVALDGSFAERRRKPDLHRRGGSVRPIREPVILRD